jgi:hypothetical protein
MGYTSSPSGDGRIPGAPRRGPGYPLQSFGSASLRQKYFRFYPLRGAKMASLPFLRFTFLRSKNVGIRNSQHPCRPSLFRFAKTPGNKTAVHAIWGLWVFASQKPGNP